MVEGLVLVCPLEQRVNQRHTDELAVLDLAEVGRTRVVVDRTRDFVHARQRVEDNHILAGRLQLVGVEHEAVLHAVELLLVEEALLLHARHVEDVELRHHLLHGAHLVELQLRVGAHLLQHVVGQAQLLGRNQNHADALVARERLDERVHRAAELQVAAEADGQVVEAPLLTLDGEQVRKRLRRVGVAAVTGVDDRDAGILRRHQRGTLLEVAHGDDVGEAADDAHRVGHGLALRYGGGIGVREADDGAPQLQHGRREAQTRTRRGFVEERRQLLSLAGFAVFGAVSDDVLGQRHNLFGFGDRQVGRVYQMSHIRQSAISGFHIVQRQPLSAASSSRPRGCRGSGAGAPCPRAGCSPRRQPPPPGRRGSRGCS